MNGYIVPENKFNETFNAKHREAIVRFISAELLQNPTMSLNIPPGKMGRGGTVVPMVPNTIQLGAWDAWIEYNWTVKKEIIGTETKAQFYIDFEYIVIWPSGKKHPNHVKMRSDRMRAIIEGRANPDNREH